MKADKRIESIKVIRKGEEVDVGLMNQFSKHEIIPNKWFDWERSANAKIVIIGQDWGPYAVLERFISDFDETKQDDEIYYRDYLFKDFSSRTEKFILNAVEKSYEERYNKKFDRQKWDNIFLTMAVLFTRQGKHFRGNQNFDPAQSSTLSYDYLSEQIKVVSPKVIMPLGNLAFEAVNQYYNLGYTKPKISKIIEEGVLERDGVKIIPNFHPAAHVDPKIQMNIWRKIWEYIEI